MMYIYYCLKTYKKKRGSQNFAHPATQVLVCPSSEDKQHRSPRCKIYKFWKMYNHTSERR